MTVEILDTSIKNSFNDEQKAMLKRIIRNIKRNADEYALYFVECNLPHLRDQLINQLNIGGNLALLTVDLHDYPIDTGVLIDEWLAKKLEFYKQENNNSQVDGVNIIGLEHLLPLGAEEQIIQTVSELNWRRSYFQHLQLPLLFWLPNYALELLATQASDFYDWYSDIYTFSSNLEQKNLGISYQMESLRHPVSKIAAGYYQTLEEKERQLKSLRALLDETNTSNDKAYVKTQIATLLYSMGNLDDALKYWKEAKNIVITMGESKAECTILNNISQVYQSKGEYEKALLYLEEAKTICENYNYNKEPIHNNMALIYIAQGSYNEALRQLNESLKLNEEGDDIALSVHYRNIAGVYSKKHDYLKSFKYFHKALFLSRNIDDKLGVIHALSGLGIIYLNLKETGVAFVYLNEALNMSRDVGDRVQESAVLYNLSSYYSLKGDLTLAMKYLKSSLTISKAVGDKENEKLTLLAIKELENMTKKNKICRH